MSEMNSLQGKKLLILGGADLHRELVNTAKKLGVETFVTDFLPLEQAPAKQAADHAWNLDITDCDAIVERARLEEIDGVLNMYYDPCQRPYQEVCERLGLPCFATKEQYEIFTNKTRFLETCVKYGVDIIPQYREEDFAVDDPGIEYPIYVKPSVSRGSRGQTVCRSYAEVAPAIAKARAESASGEVVIQHYMENVRSVTMSMFMLDGELYPAGMGEANLVRTEDGSLVTVLGISPPACDAILLEKSFPKLQHMLRELGICNAPVFIQGFMDGDVLRPYDPALRLPGHLYERKLREVTGLDVFEAMIEFAMTGAFPQQMKTLPTCRKMDGMSLALLWVHLRPGTIREIRGLDRLGEAITVSVKHHVGDRIEAWHDVRQCFCEMEFLFDNLEDVKRTVQNIYQTLQILDENGEDMKFALLDTAQLRG